MLNGRFVAGGNIPSREEPRLMSKSSTRPVCCRKNVRENSEYPAVISEL